MSLPTAPELDFRERTVAFGRSSHLRGILTVPWDTTPSACIVMFNSGILSRVGASRMQVEIARSLCGKNVASLRFDLSGLGSSEFPEGTKDIQEVVNADLDDAVDFIGTELPGVSIVGIGLCSGAYDLLQAVQRGTNWKGAMLIDLPGDYSNLQQLGQHYLSRIGKIENWTRAISQPGKSIYALKKRASLKKSNSLVVSESSEIGVRPHSNREFIERSIDTTISAGAHLYFVFTGGMSEYYNYENQFADLFPRHSKLSQVRWSYLNKADHIFTRYQDRQQLIEIVTTWLRELELTT